MIPPPDIWDPPKGPLYFAKKMLPPLTDRTHQLYLRTQGSASLLCTKKMNTPPASWNPAYWEADLWAYQVDGDAGFVNLVNMNDSSSSDRTMSIQRPSCFFNLCSSCSSRSNKRWRDCLLPPSRGRLCCRAGLTAPPYSHRWPSHPSTHPHLLLFSGDGRRSSKPSYSHTPLRVGNNCRVFPASVSFPS